MMRRRGLVAGEVRLDVGDERRRVDGVTALGLDEGRDRLAEALVGHADDGRVGHASWRLSTSSTSSGYTFSPPVLMHWLPRPSRRTVPSASTVA